MSSGEESGSVKIRNKNQSGSLDQRLSRRRGRPSRDQSEHLTETILTAASQLFLESGFLATSMDSIAARTGSSKRTLYARFASKFILFEEVIRRFAEARADEFARFETCDAPIDRILHQFAKIALIRSIEPPSIALLRLMMTEAHRLPDATLRNRDWFLDPLIRSLTRIFERGIERGEIGGADPTLMAEQFIASVCAPEVRGVALGYKDHEMSQERQDRLTRVVEMFLGGIRGRAPHATCAGS